MTGGMKKIILLLGISSYNLATIKNPGTIKRTGIFFHNDLLLQRKEELYTRLIYLMIRSGLRKSDELLQ